jgi:tetratricopeptide (TPR) repeat protein
MSADDSRHAEEARASGRQAADRAVAIDNKNSEALYIKSMLLDRHDWLGREGLLKRAVAARRLDCGCEHHQYGEMLANVGRVADAVEQLHQANDMLALYVYTPFSLAGTLVLAGQAEEAKPFFDAAIDLAPNSDFAEQIAVMKASETGDIEALLDPKLPIPAELRAALVKGYRALALPDVGAKAEAAQSLLALPEDQQDAVVARLLAGLGANREAFQIARRIVTTGEDGPSIFWHPGMRAVLNDPGFPAVADQLGLMTYWKTSHTKPDACMTKSAPPFCRSI